MLITSLWQRSYARLPTAALTAVGLAVVLLTHPIAAAATGAALVATSVTLPQARRALVTLVAVAGVAALLSLAWPYYSIVDLARDQAVYDPGSTVMYASWVEHVFPLFAALGLAFYSTGTLHRGRLAIYCALLAGLYIYGRVSGHFTDGRVISYLAIGAQIGLADLTAALEPAVLRRARGRGLALIASALAILALAELYNMRGGLRGSLPGTGSEPAIYGDYRAAVNGLPANATIAAPINDGFEATIPVYAGRLIGTHRPLAFVSDWAQRQQTVYEFFALGAPAAYRRQVITRYHVRYILAPTDEPGLLGQLRPLGSIIRSTSAFTTIAVS
jgi:hypothetical protein